MFCRLSHTVLSMLLFASLVAAQQSLPESGSHVTNTVAVRTDLTADYGSLGLSTGAAAVYRKDHGLSWDGYAEAVYDHFAKTNNLGDPSGKDSEIGLTRLVAFLGYRFSERLLVNSELRIDRDPTQYSMHFPIDSRFGPYGYPGDTNQIEPGVETAYLDYIINKSLILRGGLLLLPMGLANEHHGPDEYLGTHRPLAETVALPGTWHAVGLGLAGHKWIGSYRIYVVNGMNAAGFTINGMREARDISLDTLKNPSLVLRLDGELFTGFQMGGSYYLGNSGVFGATPEPVDLKVHTTNKEIHIVYHNGAILARALYAKALLQSTPQLNAVLGIRGLSGIGSRMVGGYVEGGYDFLAGRQNGTRLMPYARVEESNPQDALPPESVALGMLKNMQVDHLIWTFGLEVCPTPDLVLKGDYQRDRVEHVNYGVNEFSISFAYLFRH